MAELSKEDIILANKIAERIRQLRIKHYGPKPIDFANTHNVDRQLISRWESEIIMDNTTGKPKGRGVAIYTVNKFCKLIGIPLKDFFDDAIFF